MIRTLFWSRTYVARSPLGKYIILAACLLHYGWAVLLMINTHSSGATPVAVLVSQFGGRWSTVATLTTIASLAVGFLNIRVFKPISSGLYGLLLFPQLYLLILSAGSGILCAVHGHYSDGVIRPSLFILADQSPIIVLTILYGTAIIEIGRNKLYLASSENE
jgi:hypothetical protein